jgi:hypothetical protein
MFDGIISLASFPSVDFVMDGRVSFAHLMEFSHFVDLYVLEDKVYINDIDFDIFLSYGSWAPRELVGHQYFEDDKDSPLRILPKGGLTEAIGHISDLTLRIYDAAPVNFSFSLGSYDYWLALGPNEKRDLRRPSYDDYGTRVDLLYQSQRLAENIDIAIEELAKTRFTLMPSTRNLLPFLDCFHQIDTPAQSLYRAATLAQRDLLSQVISLTRPRAIYLPPLLTTLLSRCQSRREIPRRLIELRAEYAPFRTEIRSWLTELDSAQTLADKLKLQRELQAATERLIASASQRRVGFYKQVTGAFIDAAEEGDPTKMITKPAFAVLREAATTLVPEFLSVRRFTGLIDLLSESLEVQSHKGLLSRVFGSSLDISQKEITEALRYRKVVAEKYGIPLMVP